MSNQASISNLQFIGHKEGCETCLRPHKNSVNQIKNVANSFYQVSQFCFVFVFLMNDLRKRGGRGEAVTD